MKSQRLFWLQVQGATQIWTFSSPLTLEFEVDRAMFSALSIGTFRIYNLAQSTRSDIYQDFLQQNEYRPITVRAGYYSWVNVNGVANFHQLPLIFLGGVMQAQSQREGPSWVTTIQAGDGMFAVSQGDITRAIPTTGNAQQNLQQVITALVSAMPNVTIGYIDPTLGLPSVRGFFMSGSPWVDLNRLATFLYANLWIDLEKVYFVGKGSTIPDLTGGLTTITPQQGLLETPTRQSSLVSFEMIFEPRIKVGQSLNLESIETVNNGSYVVHGINHHGVISDAVAGDLRTKISCFDPRQYRQYGAIAS